MFGLKSGGRVVATLTCGLLGGGALAACSTMGGAATVANVDAARLRFDPSSGVAATVDVMGKPVAYTAYKVTYVARPNAPEKQVMAVYVPAGATQRSPIFMPLKTGAYREIDILVPEAVTAENVNAPSTGTQGTGAAHAAALALSRGMVVVSPAARGRNNTVLSEGVATEVGNGPAAVVDLKAAVRYLKFNDAAMLGDAGKIVISGTSGGGAMSSLVGVTGDSPAFRPYLQEIGAAPGSDAVFAVSPFCPITDLDNANSAYEYYFHGTGVTTFAGGGPPAPGTPPARRTLGAEDQRLSLEMARMFPAYVNGLGLKHPATGAPLRLNGHDADPAMGGTYKDYVLSVLGAAATRFIVESGYVGPDGALNAAGLAYMAETAAVNGLRTGLAPRDFLAWNPTTRAATLTDWAKFVQYLNRLKPVGSFDNGFANVSGEMDLFNTEPRETRNDRSIPAGWNHFDPNLAQAVRNAGLEGAPGYTSVRGFAIADSVAHWSAMLDPMYYLVDQSSVALKRNPHAAAMLGSSTVARHWRIRVGGYDRDSSPFVSLNLATALQNKGYDVDYRVAWNQPHTGSYDNTDMIAWIERITR